MLKTIKLLKMRRALIKESDWFEKHPAVQARFEELEDWCEELENKLNKLENDIRKPEKPN